MAAETLIEVNVPQGVTVTLSGATLTVKGQKGQVSRELRFPGIRMASSDGKITVEAAKVDKQTKATVGTFASHIRNMIKGVTEGYEYNMKIVYAHFPIQVKIEGKDKVSIGNFLGERKPRYASIMGETKVNVAGDKVTVSGNNKEHVGQTAANIEQACKIRNRDPRVFQDGVYIINKA
jgi:large subunit ribosomal protein L6